MNINQINQLSTNSNQTNQTKQAVINQQTGVSTNAIRMSLLSQFRPGDIFHGTILDITKGTMSIQVMDIGVIEAKCENLIGVHIGDTVSFLVQDKNEQQLVLRPYDMGNKNDPISQETQTVRSIRVEYPEASPKTISILLKYNLPVNQETISSFEKLMENGKPLSEHIGTLLKSLESYIPDKKERDEIKKLFSISAETTDAADLKDKLKQIRAGLKVLQELPEAKKDEVFQKELADTTKFMKLQEDLTKEFYFFACPLSLKNEQTELKVYVNDHKKGQEKGQAKSVSLRLDTENLGSLTIHISMQEDHVTAGFFTVSDSVTELLREHIPELTKTLSKKEIPFRGSVETITPKEQLDFTRDVLHENLVQENNLHIEQGMTFDIRT